MVYFFLFILDFKLLQGYVSSITENVNLNVDKFRVVFLKLLNFKTFPCCILNTTWKFL